MSHSAVFQTQLASVIDTMAKTAMTEIIKLVDDYSAILRWEMYRSQSENEGLRKKLEVMENVRQTTPGESIARATDGDVSGSGHSPGSLTRGMSLGPGAREVAEFDGGSADCDARGDGGRAYGAETALHAFLKDEPAVLPASDPEVLVIKQEGPEAGPEAGPEDGPDGGFGLGAACVQLKWEEQGAGQCPALPVARKQAEEQRCGEEWAGRFVPAEGADEQPRPLGNDSCVALPGGAEPGPGMSGGAELSSYGGGATREACCYTPPHQGALQPGSSNPDAAAAKALSCVYCGKAFPYLSYLKRHLANHTGERPHRCAQCGRGFVRRSHLVRHQQVHTGEKPYDCALCGRRFARLSHLDRHLSTHV